MYKHNYEPKTLVLGNVKRPRNPPVSERRLVKGLESAIRVIQYKNPNPLDSISSQAYFLISHLPYSFKLAIDRLITFKLGICDV